MAGVVERETGVREALLDTTALGNVACVMTETDVVMRTRLCENKSGREGEEKEGEVEMRGE